MKKILIVSENPHNTIGGIETYNRELIRIFLSHNFEVDEYSFRFNKNPIKVCELNNSVNQLGNNKCEWSRFKKIRLGVKFLDSIMDDYDLIINSVANIPWTKNIYDSKKIIFVQHFNKDFYMQKYIAGKFLRPLIYFGMWLVGIKNPFKKFKNIVFFSKADAEQILPIKRKKINFCDIPLAKYSENEIKNFRKMKNDKKKKDFFYVGRIDDRQKNIKLIKSVFTKNKLSIDIYGSGNEKIMVDNHFVKFKGFIRPDEINGIYDNYYYNVLLSKYEGFPFSIVEAMSHGIPSISTDSSCNIKWLIDDRGFLIKNIEKDFNLNNVKEMLDNDYNNISSKCFDFALENLTKEKFEEKWINFISKLI